MSGLFPILLHGLVELEDPCQGGIGWGVEPHSFRKDLEERTVEAVAVEESREMDKVDVPALKCEA